MFIEIRYITQLINYSTLLLHTITHKITFSIEITSTNLTRAGFDIGFVSELVTEIFVQFNNRTFRIQFTCYYCYIHIFKLIIIIFSILYTTNFHEIPDSTDNLCSIYFAKYCIRCTLFY